MRVFSWVSRLAATKYHVRRACRTRISNLIDTRIFFIVLSLNTSSVVSFAFNSGSYASSSSRPWLIWRAVLYSSFPCFRIIIQSRWPDNRRRVYSNVYRTFLRDDEFILDTNNDQDKCWLLEVHGGRDQTFLSAWRKSSPQQCMSF